jgi:uncharacterized protein (DUF433 family)
MPTDPITTRAEAPEPHIEATPGVCGGKPRIAGHRIRVQDIAIWTEQGQSADEIVADFPQLDLADVYAALAYYHDHREQIDRDIREDHEFVQKQKSQSGPGVLGQLAVEDPRGGNPVPS